jgi:phage terminase large subunit-like protein
LTQWPDDKAYVYLLSRIRRAAGDAVPLRSLGASNPGSAGHEWVKARFVGGTDITGRRIVPDHPYVPAKIEDNPHLDQEAYVLSLMELHPTVRKQLRDGDWGARQPGDYFRAEWFGPLIDEQKYPLPDGEYIEVRWWDLAASTSKDAARTAGVKMARMKSGVRVIRHAAAFRATPGERDAAIVRQAELDGRGCIVGIEIEGGSGGPAQFMALERVLKSRGFRVAGARPRAELKSDKDKRYMMRNPMHDRGKAARADPVASCLERGHQMRGECPDTDTPWWGLDIGRPLLHQRDGIRLVMGAWTQAYLDELEPFPTEGATVDLVDATSGGYAWLEAHPWGSAPPIEDILSGAARAVESADVHPDARPDPSRESPLVVVSPRDPRIRDVLHPDPGSWREYF